jgi:hypothetical protein
MLYFADKNDPSEIAPFIEAALIPGAAAAAVLGVVLFATLVSILCFCYCCSKQKRKREDEERNDVNAYHKNRSETLLKALDTLKEMSKNNNSTKDKGTMIKMVEEIIKALADQPLNLNVAIEVVRSANDGDTSSVDSYGSRKSDYDLRKPQGVSTTREGEVTVKRFHALEASAPQDHRWKREADNSTDNSKLDRTADSKAEVGDRRLCGEEDMADSEAELASHFAQVAHALLCMGTSHSLFKHRLKETLTKGKAR